MPTRDKALARLGANIRAKREEKELSQEALAELADLDRTYIGGVERGERNSTILSLLRIAKALKISVGKLCEEID